MPVVRELSNATIEAGNDRHAKRLKIEHGADADIDTMHMHLKNKNAQLKGRRRYLADLEDMAQACGPGFIVRGFGVRYLRVGDDEGTIEFKVSHNDQHVVSVNLLVSDTSEYPKEHTFYAFTPDAVTPPPVLQVIEHISSDGSRTIYDTIYRALCSIAHQINPALHGLLEADSQVSDVMDEVDDEEFVDYDDDEAFGLPSSTSTSLLQLAHLQEDFVEIIATSTHYRPGFIPFGNDAFALSVSLPVVELAASIPPRALQAWDRRLLARAQHLTLLISGFRSVYPPLDARDGLYTRDARAHGAALTFRVGLTGSYKPSKEHAQDAARTFALLVPETQEAPEEADAQEPMDHDEMEMLTSTGAEREEEYNPRKLEKFALSTALESLMDAQFLRVLQLRLQYGVGWAGAELLFAEAERSQTPTEKLQARMKKELKVADKEERDLVRMYNYQLPPDPLVDFERRQQLNVPLIAFSYLLRRLMLCSKFCMVCHNKIESEYEALKPYVCGSKLCEYQYYQLSMGPSLEYEICANSVTVDLLVSMSYCAAAEGKLDPLPIGLGLRVPPPKRAVTTPGSYLGMSSIPLPPSVSAGPQPVTVQAIPEADDDGLVDFDQLHPLRQMGAVAEQLDSIPSVPDMKAYLNKKLKAGKQKPLVKDMAPEVLPAAWSIVRWCLGSCTAHLEELTDPDEMVQNIDASWKQYRFSVGAPDAEAKFNKALVEAQEIDSNAKEYPALYAFHGSPFRNWHSIIRNGLWAKEVAHGRAYGNGVYFALQGETSMGSYAIGTSTRWKNSDSSPTNGVALAEIVNLPSRFASKSPYLVVPETSWIICRYLLVKTASATGSEGEAGNDVPFVALDPHFKITLSGKAVKIPQPTYKISKILNSHRHEHVDEDYDADDAGVFDFGSAKARGSHERPIAVDSEDDAEGEADDYDESWAYGDAGGAEVSKADKGKSKAAAAAPLPTLPANDWEHDPGWVEECVAHIMPPPVDAAQGATLALQRELKTMLKEQNNAHSLRELGWYLPPDNIDDNLYQWIVELHSFEDALPIAADLKARGVNSLVFEIRFPSSFPHSPPFFRIIKPRFLPFFMGGGGHVTGGGSICMDLLTTNGWLPSYSISAVLLQIRLAISNLDPRPARLACNWDVPYGVGEALEGYKRAAMTHGWTIPDGLDKLVR